MLMATAITFGKKKLPIQMDKVVIIAPHPDDEVFGCAGLISRVKKKHGALHVIFLTDGENAHSACCDIKQEAVSKNRRKLTVDAARYLELPANSFTYLGWPDSMLAKCMLEKNISKVEELRSILTNLSPNVVFCPHPFEGWVDHIEAELITREAVAKMEPVPSLFHYCVWFWYSMPFLRAQRCNWRNAFTIDITDVYTQKQKAIEAYTSPCAPCGNPWSGNLPKDFLKAFHWKKELFFKAKKTD